MSVSRSPYVQALQQRVLVFDGAMGTSIQRYDLSADDFGGETLEGCNDFLVISKPSVIEEVHASFLEAGCDVLETDTFRSNRLTLREYALQDRVREINVAAASLARRVADRFSTPERPRFVAGSIGPSGFLPSASDPTLGNIRFGELVPVFREQAAALIEGGVDVLLIETSQDILEVKAAVFGCRQAIQQSGRAVALQVQVTLDTSGRMLLGTDIGAAMVTIESLGADVIGLNCSTGPEHMRQAVRFLGENSRLPISVIPNAGIPHNEGGVAVYPMQPEPFAEQMAEFVVEFGVGVVGGCCGTTPDHIRELVQRVGGREPKHREVEYVPRLSSGIRSTDLVQEPRPTMIGERVNSQGSRKVKRFLLDDDYDGVMEVARDQTESGAHVLDVCVALTERSDEDDQMRSVVKLLSQGVEAPLCIDSTEAEVIQAALEQSPGRAVVNSINLENGREKIDVVLPLVRDHGAAVIALTIDNEHGGMAKTADVKLASRARSTTSRSAISALAPDALIFDALTFTLATGDEEFRRSAEETIEGIRAIKRELPGVLTVLGVSNVSFGLQTHARAVLNSVFLHHCVEAGLDMAIINPAHVRPYFEIGEAERRLCDDLIFDRRTEDRDPLAAFIAHFEGQDATVESTVDPTAEMEPEHALHWKILHRKKDGIDPLIDRAVEKFGAVPVLNDVLLPAMKEVGDKFGAGELILPFVLQSAEVMKKAVARLENYLEKAEGQTKGKVVLATVYGDVHDIGKSLVNTILTNNGYTVFDLGKQVPVNTIIEGGGRDRPFGAAGLDVQTDAVVRPGTAPPRARVPAAGRWRGDQPELCARRGADRGGAAVPLRDVLLQGRVRGSRDDGPARRGRRRRVRARAQRGDGAAQPRVCRAQGPRPRDAAGLRERRRRPRRGRSHTAVLGLEGARQDRCRRSRRVHRPQHVVPNAVGRQEPQGRGMGPPGSRGVRAPPGTLHTRGAHAGLAPAARDLRLLPGRPRRRRRRRL